MPHDYAHRIGKSGRSKRHSSSKILVFVLANNRRYKIRQVKSSSASRSFFFRVPLWGEGNVVHLNILYQHVLEGYLGQVFNVLCRRPTLEHVQNELLLVDHQSFLLTHMEYVTA